MSLDDIDARIVTALIKDARASYAVIGNEVGLSAPAVNLTQDLFASAPLPQTARIMVKDEDLCVHCGLCAERCPTAAWDMQKFELFISYAGAEACIPTQIA